MYLISLRTSGSSVATGMGKFSHDEREKRESPSRCQGRDGIQISAGASNPRYLGSFDGLPGPPRIPTRQREWRPGIGEV